MNIKPLQNNALRIAFFQTNSRLRSKTRKYGFLPNSKLKL